MSLPPLPALPEELELQVLTHRGYANTDNEKLAFLGRGVLAACVSKLIFDTFPNQSARKLNSINGKLQQHQKERLSAYAVEYELVKRIRCVENTRSGLELSVDFRVTLMEAFVGASVLHAGFDTTSQWVAGLFETTVGEIAAALPLSDPPISPVRLTHESPKGKPEGSQDGGSPTSPKSEKLSGQPSHMGLLSKLNLGAVKRYEKLVWAFEEEGQSPNKQWAATVTLKDEVVGKGAAKSKQVAKELAAKDALDTLHWD